MTGRFYSKLACLDILCLLCQEILIKVSLLELKFRKPQAAFHNNHHPDRRFTRPLKKYFYVKLSSLSLNCTFYIIDILMMREEHGITTHSVPSYSQYMDYWLSLVVKVVTSPSGRLRLAVLTPGRLCILVWMPSSIVSIYYLFTHNELQLNCHSTQL